MVNAHLIRASEGSSDDALTWFRTGAPHEELNGVLRVESEQVVQSLRVLKSSPGLWHSWRSDPRRDELERQLTERGFEFVEEEPLMTTSTPSIQLEDHTIGRGLRFVRVENMVALVDWTKIWLGSGELPAKIADVLGQFALGPHRVVHHVLAYLDDVPVGCFAVVITPQGAAVEHVVTLASHRRRGIGTALTREALMIAAREGARTAILTASPEGRSIYETIGFREVDSVRRFRPPPP